jgi:hypothetical protein
MFLLLTTWISQRIITVTAVTVLTVAAVPTTLVIVSHDDHNTVALVQPVNDDQKAVLIADVKKAGDDVIAKLNTEESSCSGQIAHAVNSSSVAAKLQNKLANAKTFVRGDTNPFVLAIQKDEDRFAHLAVMTQQDEENELANLDLIQVIALGNGSSGGTLTVTCQNILITIKETIQITVTQVTLPANCQVDDELD